MRFVSSRCAGFQRRRESDVDSGALPWASVIAGIRPADSDDELNIHPLKKLDVERI